MSQPLKSSLRAPEGKWMAANERRPTTNFSPDLTVHLTYAEVSTDEGSPPLELLIFNTQHLLYVCYPQAVDREPLRVIDLRQFGGSVLAYPTCHAYTPAAKDEFDLAVGLSTGEVVLLSLRAQLRAPPSTTRPASSMCLNVDGSAGTAARCVSLSWVPGSDGTAFVAAHRDGTVLLYRKVVGSSSDSKLLARTSSSGALRTPISTLQGPGVGGGASAAAVSPDGQHVAVAGKDGGLRLYSYPSSGVVGGFKSYYGGLLCCCWSPDGRYVAAGGEDDLLAVYGLAERCVVAYCRGHSSWVSGVAFDPWMCDTGAGDEEQQQQQQGSNQQLAEQQQQQQQAPDPACGPALGAARRDRVYRLASVAQDCQLALWDIVVTEEAVAAAQQASSQNPSPERERPGLPPSPSKRRGGGIGGVSSSSRSASPVKRHGSGFAAFRSRGGFGGGGGSSDPGALPVALPTGTIAPPLPRADWPLVTPVAQAKVHPEPLSSVLFTPAALLTACHGSCVRRWARPPLTQAAVVQRIDSLQSLQKAGQAS